MWESQLKQAACQAQTSEKFLDGGKIKPVQNSKWGHIQGKWPGASAGAADEKKYQRVMIEGVGKKGQISEEEK